jgi:DNA-binding transcriptional LysR family regulator
MGVTLFIRTTRTLRLTTAGTRLFNQSQQALADINRALLATVDDVQEVQGVIRVNCVGGYLGEELIATLAHRFMLLHPKVSIMLDLSSHRIDLIEEDFDVAFRMGQLQDSGFVARRLTTIEMGTFASPGYLAKSGYPSSPKQLSAHRCLTGTVKKWRFEHKEQGIEQEVQVSGAFECKNGRSLIRGAMMGNGIVRLPNIYCQQELDEDALIEVFDHWRIPSVDFSMLYHKDRYQPQRLKAFIDFVVNDFASQSN